jgi:sulfur carrier protein ThiS
MTDEHGFDEDPQLRALLGQSDPARSLAPADPNGLARLLLHIQEDTVNTDLDTRTDLPQQTTDLRRRGPLAWLVAAAAVAAIAGGGYAAVSSMQDSGTVDQAGPSTPSADEPVVVTLEAPTTVPARCAVPTPELLGSAEIAFAGTVTAINGDVVTLAPTETYAGQSADEIEVVGLRPDLRALVGQPEFVVGGTYLVSATGGQMSACGFSGEASAELQNLYDLAFR